MHGIHHVTAIAGKAQRNLDFYTRVIGLRFVKRTVNFDDPGTYHFYFGDETGRPGTISLWRDLGCVARVEAESACQSSVTPALPKRV